VASPETALAGDSAVQRCADGGRRLHATNPPKKIELIKYDSQGSPDQAVPLVTKAAQQDKIVG